MIKTSRQLKDLIRNLSRKNSADAQILMRNYMMERFLERISLSIYRDKFILKGGMLVAAMVGLDARSTMDLDATIKGVNVDVKDVEADFLCLHHLLAQEDEGDGSPQAPDNLSHRDGPQVVKGLKAHGKQDDNV